MMAKSDQKGDTRWDAGREGYVSAQNKFIPTVAIPKLPKKQAGQSNFLSIRGEERFGSLVAAAGTIWVVYVATVDYSALWRVQIMPPGPVEVCILGILAWLHAKWRRSIQP